MIPLPSPATFKLAGIAAALVAAFVGGCETQKGIEAKAKLELSEQHQRETAKIVQDWAANMAAATKRMIDAEVKRDENQSLIDKLHADSRVRIHIPVCPPAGTAADAEARAGEDGAAGTLSERVDAAFEKFQSGTGDLVYRCDRLNIDAIRLNSAMGQ